MLDRRRAGVLAHPTSLPGKSGMGDLGEGTIEFLDFLEAAGQSVWQILPLGPPGGGDSPYTALSSFAGNPWLINLELLVVKGFLRPDSRDAFEDGDPWRVDFQKVEAHKRYRLTEVAGVFAKSIPKRERESWEAFLREESYWLDDYALFMSIREEYEGQGVFGAWFDVWDPKLACREPAAIERARDRLAGDIFRHKVWQYLFYSQWKRVHREAGKRGIFIFGDIPIFTAADSADVWSHPEFFQLKSSGKPKSVAGVPPDYFSPTGQLWGNPLYNWKALKETEYDWWIRRFTQALKLVDLVRIDHFRGFESFWSVPGSAETAEAGKWVKAPGRDFFKTLKSKIPDLPVVAEDLGVITEEVEKLRDRFDFPGMKVLHFGFDIKRPGVVKGDHAFLPQNYPVNSVVYTGTHDNNTTMGWFADLDEYHKDGVRRYLARDCHDVAWDLIRLAHQSVARLAIIPVQDLLSLGAEHRMNIPSTPFGNWSWRFPSGALDNFIASRLRDLSDMTGRIADE